MFHVKHERGGTTGQKGSTMHPHDVESPIRFTVGEIAVIRDAIVNGMIPLHHIDDARTIVRKIDQESE